MATSVQNSVKARFDADALSEFLNHGWMLALDADRILVGWGEWSEAANPALDANSCSVFAPDFYFEASRPWRSTRNWDLLERDRFATHVLTGLRVIVNSNSSGKDQQFQWVEPEFSDFEKPWSQIRRSMSEHGLKKAVPVVYERAQGVLTKRRLAQILRSLVGLPKELYLYGFWSENTGLIGATPEVLFSKFAEGPIETMALAGTRAKDADECDGPGQLLRDPKERYEHQLVVDDLKERLSQIGDVGIGSTEVLQLPTLYHLRTRLRARPHAPFTFEQMARSLHPTPALGLAPRALGFDEMRKWDDPTVRSRFGAPFGVTGPFGQHCVVAIRGIEWRGDRLQLGSGCGVVEDSRIEREWQELRLKRESVKRMLGL